MGLSSVDRRVRLRHECVLTKPVTRFALAAHIRLRKHSSADRNTFSNPFREIPQPVY